MNVFGSDGLKNTVHSIHHCLNHFISIFIGCIEQLITSSDIETVESIIQSLELQIVLENRLYSELLLGLPDFDGELF